MASHPWLRWYTDAMADPKILGLSYAHRWLWVTVLSAARTSSLAGYLLVAEGMPWTEQELAGFGGLKVTEVRAGLVELHRRRMIEHSVEHGCWHVTKWDERQFESDSSAERTRAYRAKQRRGDPPVTSQVTLLGDVTCDVPEQNRAEQKQKTIFETEFNSLWSLYPRREARLPALKAYQARRNEGIPYEDLELAVGNFAAVMADREPQHVLQGSTFFGPNERWRDYLEAPKPAPVERHNGVPLGYFDRHG